MDMRRHADGIGISLNLRPKDPAWSLDAGLESDSQSNSFRDVAFFGMTLYTRASANQASSPGRGFKFSLTTFKLQLGHNLTLGIRKY